MTTYSDPDMIKEKRFGLLCLWIGLLLAAFTIGMWVTQANAHDLYTPLKSPAGASCCGGDDCEGAIDYKINRDGSVDI